jgi:hypothetical protein
VAAQSLGPIGREVPGVPAQGSGADHRLDQLVVPPAHLLCDLPDSPRELEVIEGVFVPRLPPPEPTKQPLLERVVFLEIGPVPPRRHDHSSLVVAEERQPVEGE